MNIYFVGFREWGEKGGREAVVEIVVGFVDIVFVFKFKDKVKNSIRFFRVKILNLLFFLVLGF